MLRIVQWTVGFVLTALMFFASVGPKSAESNISFWLALFGLEDAANATADLVVHPAALWTFGAILIGSLLPSFINHLPDRVLSSDAGVKRGRGWAKGLALMSIKDVGCAVAGVTPTSFEHSPRAQAVANEILSMVNDGWIPTATEISNEGGISISIMGQPNYSKKKTGLGEIIPVDRITRRFGRKKWDLGWSGKLENRTNIWSRFAKKLTENYSKLRGTFSS